jgi:eukaryotic-like serine/threonine-protein kinase
MWAPGARFGKYKLVERLGKGGMAETWRGELLAAEGVRKAVVIKRVLPNFADNKEFIEAFVQEAKVTASLSHGNVAQVFDFGQIGDSHFIAMELIDGRSLDRVLKHGIARGYWHMPYPIATLITLEVAKGLEHVHTRRGPKGALNIVHRDISPDNIIVGINGETKLVDFGVAKSVLEGRNETEAGVIKGKYIYFSPEQAAGEKVDFRTDIYALGVVLYRLVTGRKAFDGPGLKVLKQIQKGEYVPLRVANPDIPDQLATVIETMMATRKEDRFGSTLELVEALSACVVAMAPRAGVHWIRDWVRWLYEEDLKKRGEEPGLRAGFTDLIEQWKPGPKPTLSGEMVSTVGADSRPGELATIASRRSGRGSSASGASVSEPVKPWSTRQKIYAGLAGAGVAGLVLAVLAIASPSDPNSGESDEARGKRIAEAVRMKPLDGQRPTVEAFPAPAAGGSDEPPQAVDPDEATRDAPPVANDPPPQPDVKKVQVSYDAEVAPVSFTLSNHHRLSLDDAPVLMGTGGHISEAGPLPSGNVRAGAFTFPEMGNPTGAGGTKQWTFITPPTAGAANAGEQLVVPVWLFAPGKPPVAELLASGSGRWSRAGTRLALIVGSAREVPSTPLNPVANGKRILARGAVVVVDALDRFTINDLSGRDTWKVTVTAKPNAGESVPPVILFAAGGSGVRLDGRSTVGGYAVLTLGTHRLSGATAAWLTVPTLSTLELANVDVSFSP